ncbi:MAG: hypothetical protein ACPGUV_03905 [Polyangiales bacterium]
MRRSSQEGHPAWMWALGALCASACATTASSTPRAATGQSPAPEGTHLRIIHLIQQRGDLRIDVSAKAGTARHFVSLHYADTRTMRLPSGNAQLHIAGHGNRAVEQVVLWLQEDERHKTRAGSTIVLVRAIDDTNHWLYRQSVDLQQPARRDTARLRFFHAFNGVDAVDVCLPGERLTDPGTPLFRKVRYGHFGAGLADAPAYTELPGDTLVVVQVRVHRDALCTGRVLGWSDLQLAHGTNHTLLLQHKTTEGPEADTAQFMYCVDPPARRDRCVAMPLRR